MGTGKPNDDGTQQEKQEENDKTYLGGPGGPLTQEEQCEVEKLRRRLERGVITPQRRGW